MSDQKRKDRGDDASEESDQRPPKITKRTADNEDAAPMPVSSSSAGAAPVSPVITGQPVPSVDVKREDRDKDRDDKDRRDKEKKYSSSSREKERDRDRDRDREREQKDKDRDRRDRDRDRDSRDKDKEREREREKEKEREDKYRERQRQREKEDADRRQRERERERERDRERERERDRPRTPPRSGDRNDRAPDRGRASDTRKDPRGGVAAAKPAAKTPANGAPPKESKSEAERLKELKELAKQFPPDSEEAMMLNMGIPVGFNTTKGKHVEGSDVSAVKIIEKHKYRQYMNRRGGFHRAAEGEAGQPT